MVRPTRACALAQTRFSLKGAPELCYFNNYDNYTGIRMHRTFFDGLCSHIQKKVLVISFFSLVIFKAVIYAFIESNFYVS